MYLNKVLSLSLQGLSGAAWLHRPQSPVPAAAKQGDDGEPRPTADGGDGRQVQQLPQRHSPHRLRAQISRRAGSDDIRPRSRVIRPCSGDVED